MQGDKQIVHFVSFAKKTVAFFSIAFSTVRRLTAAREHRSIANMVEILIRNHCRLDEMAILEQEK